MAFSIKKRSIDAAIPTASMADIAFLLIIFFMVTTTFQVDKSEIHIPKTLYREETIKTSAFIVLQNTGIILFSGGRDSSFVTGTDWDLDSLIGPIREVTSVNSLHPFIIKADADIDYAFIDRTLEILRDEHAKNVVFLSSQKTIKDL